MQRSLLALFSLILACLAQGEVMTGSSTQPNRFTEKDLVGPSAFCEQQKKESPEIKKCDLRKKDFTINFNPIETKLLQQTGEKLAADVRKDFFDKIEKSLVSQFAAATWISQKNPVSGNDAQLARAFQDAKFKCAGPNRKPFESMREKIDQLKPNSRSEKASKNRKETVTQSREFLQKRMLIAWTEINRIERFLADRSLSKDEQEKLKKRLLKIKEAYPLVANSSQALTVQNLTQLYYGDVFNPDSTKSHPQMDQILFPDASGSFVAVTAGDQKQNGNEGLVNNILSKPMNSKVASEIERLSIQSLAKGVESVGAFCELNACQTLQLDMPTTAEQINRYQENSKVAAQAACSCNLRSKTEAVGTGTQLALVGATLGGIVLCPIPMLMGAGCFGAAVASTGLTASSAMNALGAIQDQIEIQALVRTAKALPGLSEEEKKKIFSDENETMSRFLGNVADVALSGPALKQTSKGIPRFQKYFDKPIPVQEVTPIEIYHATVSQKEELTQAGVQFKTMADEETYMYGVVKYKYDDFIYKAVKGSKDYYGEMLKITKLPKPVAKGGPETPAFFHPEMPAYMKKLEEIGFDLVTDTSIGSTAMGSYIWGNKLSISAGTSWKNFVHEVQHAQFMHFKNSKGYEKLASQLQIQGTSVQDVMGSEAVRSYSPKELAYMEKLLKQGNTELAVNESLSISRELDTMGWRQYLPSAAEARIYGANHRVYELETLKSKGVELSANQKEALKNGKSQIIFLKSYEKSPTAVVVSAQQGGYVIHENLNWLYNEKSGDMITQTPDGKVIRTQSKDR